MANFGEFERLMLTFILWTAANGFGASLLYLYLDGAGLSALEMLVIGTLTYLLPFIYLLFLRKLDTKWSLPLGIASVAVGYGVFAVLGGFWGAAALMAIGALCFLFFWTPFNVLWFEVRGKENAGHSSTYNGIAFLLGAVAPAAAGLVAAGYGYTALFACAAVLMLPAMLSAAKFMPKRRMEFHPISSIRSLSGFRTLFFIEGFFTIGFVVLIPLLSIRFFPKPEEFGLFFTGTTVVSVGMSMLLSRVSDSAGRRREFVVFSALGVGASLLLGAFAGGAGLWFIAVMLGNFFRIVFYPFPLALMLDNRERMEESMYGREIMLNMGRAAGGIMSIACFLLLPDLRAPLALFGLSMLIYAAIFEFMKRKNMGRR